MRNSTNRKHKRSFRPKASSIFGLDNEEVIRVQNTGSRTGEEEHEIKMNVVDSTFVSSQEDENINSAKQREIMNAKSGVQKGKQSKEDKFRGQFEPIVVKQKKSPMGSKK